MPISPFPPHPSRSDPTTFADKGDAYLAHLESPFVAEANALEANVNAKEASTNALSLAAVNAVNISAWASGTTYAVGVTVYDPVDLLSYRRSNAGAGTTRPGLDNANWVVLNGLGNVRLDTNQTFTGVNTFSQPIVGSGASLTNLDASSLATGIVAPGRLGSGVANATTALLGNSTYGRYYDPVAIAEGAAGAPRVSWNAIEDQSHVVAWNASTTSIDYNSTIAGGDLRLASTSPSSVSFTPYVGNATFNTGVGVVSLTGTWRNIGGRCTGRTGGAGEYYFYPSIWVRIA